MLTFIAYTALVLTSAPAIDLTLPPEQLGQDSGIAIGETLTLTDSVTVKMLGVIEDSRCPINARCIQAGRLVIRVQATRDGVTKAFTMEPWTSADFAGGQLTFSGAPARGLTSDKSAMDGGGRYNFTYTPAQKL